VARALLVHLLLVGWRCATGVPRAQGATEGSPFARLNRSVESLELLVLHVCKEAPDQHSKLRVRQGCKLQQARVQPFELAFSVVLESGESPRLNNYSAFAAATTRDDRQGYRKQQ
jgi:hypothetical protein